MASAPVDSPPARLRPLSMGALAMCFVGGSTAVSGVLRDAPLFAPQAVRYLAAFLVVLAVARAAHAPLVRPRGPEWLWLAGVAATGLVLFNVALVRGSEHAEPAVFGVAVAGVPVLLAVLGPLGSGTTPDRRLIAAAVVVSVGAALVNGFGRSDLTGLLWAGVVLATEAAFTLMAVPVLARHTAWGVTVHTTWIGAAMFAALAIATEGPDALTELAAREWAAITYLALLVTAAAFLLWYSSVHALTAGTAGLLTGIAPVAAVAMGVALGEPVPSAGVWLGIATVALGLGAGLARPLAAGRR